MADDPRQVDDLEVTIDLAAAEGLDPDPRVVETEEEDHPSPPAPRTRGRGGWVAALVILAVAAVAAGAWSAVLASRGQGWQERAEAYELRAHSLEHDLETVTAAQQEAETRLAAAASGLAETRRLLQLSEEDVVALESRVGSLANEKAQVEDERERVRDEAQVLGSVASLATAAGADLDACVANLSAWLGAPPAQGAPAAAWDAWAARGDLIGAQCTAAQASFDELQASIDG